MSRVQTIIIDNDQPEQRLDRWMRKVFPQVKQGQIEKMCRKGDLRVDGAKAKSNTRVGPGTEIRIPPLPDTNVTYAKETTRVSEKDAQLMRDCVIYKDAHLIVINKPAGLPTQGGSNQTRHVDGLCVAPPEDFAEKPRLVHRLDKDTSGVLVLARTPAMASKMTEAFRHRNTRKIYWALVAGVPTPYLGEIKYGLEERRVGKEWRGRKDDRCPPAQRSIVQKAPSAHIRCTLRSTVWPRGPLGLRWSRLRDAHTSCAFIWPRLVTRSLVTANTADQVRKHGRWMGRTTGRDHFQKAAPACPLVDL